MKTNITLLLLACFCFLKSNAQYDKTLADSLGADAYGMKIYYLVILKTGPAATKDEASKNILLRGHMENIKRLAKEGKLVVAGPMMDNDKHYEGIFIFNAKTKEEVEGFLKADPAISAGLLDTEIYNWYGSAALPMYLPFHYKIESQQH
jgi:uncharacterized protein YciI